MRQAGLEEKVIKKTVMSFYQMEGFTLATLILNRLFLNNVKVKSFAKFRKNNSLLTNASEMGDNELKACLTTQWSLANVTESKCHKIR